MAYQAAKRMTLAGVKVGPGDILDEELLGDMPTGRLDSLRRVGHIVEVVDTPKLKARKRKQPEPETLETTPEEEAVEEESSTDDSTTVSSDPEAST